MAWAHLAGTGNCHAPASSMVAQMSPDCPQHHASNRSGPGQPAKHHTLPCCEGGSCSCATPPPLLMSHFPSQPSQAIVSRTMELRPRAAVSTILDDALRPPIY
jgi:hypothetical protein